MTVASVRDLRVRFGERGPVALDGLDLDVSAGEVVVLRGPSGAGKTTVLRALAGVLIEFHGGRMSGRVEVCGTDATRSPAARVARVAALAFQDPEAQAVMSTVARDVAFGPESLGIDRSGIDARVRWALDATGASHLSGRQVATLSGGERQRAALASVLAMRTPLLLLDEPTSQVDDDAAGWILGAVRRLADERGVAVVVSEHRADRAAAVADRAVDVGPPAPAAGGVLPSPAADGPERAGLDAVTVRLDGVTVLEGATLRLRAGRVTAITGPSGSGKTTVLRVLAGLRAPDEGRVVVDGDDVTAVPAERRFPRIGMVPQAPGRHLLCETVADEVAYALRNLGVPASARRERVAVALERHGIAGLAARHPLDLSVGQRERVAIAAAAVADPAVLLLDEPTRGVHPAARDHLGALLREHAAGGSAVLVATHDPAFVERWCDDVLVVRDGRITAYGRQPA